MFLKYYGSDHRVTDDQAVLAEAYKHNANLKPADCSDFSTRCF